jgi:hypothetical protein
VRHDLLSHFSKFVWNANISLRQATKDSTRQFCDSLIEYGFRFVHLSLDARSFHGNKILDVVLLQRDPRTCCIDHFLVDSRELSHGTQSIYETAPVEVIARLTANEIHIISVVGKLPSIELSDRSLFLRNFDRYVTSFASIR